MYFFLFMRIIKNVPRARISILTCLYERDNSVIKFHCSIVIWRIASNAVDVTRVNI